MKHYLAILLILASTAEAATQRIRYINAGCANNGNGQAQSCASSPGGAGPYNSTVNAITGEKGNLVSADVWLDLQGEGTAADTSSPAFLSADWTLDATRYVQLRTVGSNRPNGLYPSSTFRIENNAYEAVVDVTIPFFRIDGVPLKQTKTSAGAGTPAYGIHLHSAAATSAYTIANCMFWYGGDYTNQNAKGIRNEGTATTETLNIWNNIFYLWKTGINAGPGGAGQTVNIYNNTIIDSTTSGIEDRYTAGTLNLKNNLIQGSATNWTNGGNTGGTLNSADNITSDATSPNTSGCNGTAGTCRNVTVSFVSTAAKNYHLQSSDTQAKDYGTDLSGSFTTDIDGQTRSGSWDIGADEYQASASYFPPSRLNGGINLNLNGGIN